MSSHICRKETHEKVSDLIYFDSAVSMIQEVSGQHANDVWSHAVVRLDVEITLEVGSANETF